MPRQHRTHLRNQRSQTHLQFRKELVSGKRSAENGKSRWRRQRRERRGRQNLRTRLPNPVLYRATAIEQPLVADAAANLSACSTGRGPLSPDGIVGLTRAFFAAGASAVVATLWDVPDGPSARVMGAFYRQLARDGARDRALRSAQLGVLRALRGGRIRVTFGGHDVVLPEHPALWAGFVLLGEP